MLGYFKRQAMQCPIMHHLQDNQIHTEGAKSLARVLKSNQALTSLNLRYVEWPFQLLLCVHA